MSKTGTVKNWNDEKGFGFIGPDDGSEDLFCHRSSLAGLESLERGAKVYYDAGWDDKKQKARANNVTMANGGGGGGGYGSNGGNGGKYWGYRSATAGYQPEEEAGAGGGGGYGVSARGGDFGGGGGGYGPGGRASQCGLYGGGGGYAGAAGNSNDNVSGGSGICIRQYLVDKA